MWLSRSSPKPGKVPNRDADPDSSPLANFHAVHCRSPTSLAFHSASIPDKGNLYAMHWRNDLTASDIPGKRFRIFRAAGSHERMTRPELRIIRLRPAKSNLHFGFDGRAASNKVTAA